MKKIISLIIASATIGVFAQVESFKHDWTATLKIIDERGNPVSEARATVYYMLTNSFVGLTDTNGIFIASSHDQSVDLAFRVEKSGYYRTRMDYHLGFNYDAARWNPTQTILLRKIGKPIPMYAQQARIEIPELGKPIGFDLMEGDWVAPYGRGKQSDFIFQAQRRFNSWQDFDSSFRLTFHAPGDGLFAIAMPPDQGSELRLPAIAPQDGYVAELSEQLNDTPSKGWEKSEKKDQNYYFRVRTAKDDRGNIVSAHYGKIYGDFRIDAINSKTLLIFFQYYLNPTPNDRNVEFDPKQNLLGGLRFDAQVKAP
jgi:hypothetical protein